MVWMLPLFLPMHMVKNKIKSVKKALSQPLFPLSSSLQMQLLLLPVFPVTWSYLETYHFAEILQVQGPNQ